jgi:hypothetical protein
MSFPELFFEIIILLALGLMATASITLLVLVFRDIKTKKLW